MKDVKVLINIHGKSPGAIIPGGAVKDTVWETWAKEGHVNGGQLICKFVDSEPTKKPEPKKTKGAKNDKN